MPHSFSMRTAKIGRALRCVGRRGADRDTADRRLARSAPAFPHRWGGAIVAWRGSATSRSDRPASLGRYRARSTGWGPSAPTGCRSRCRRSRSWRSGQPDCRRVRLLRAEAFSRAARAVTSHRPFRAGGSVRLAMPKAGHVARNRLPHPVLACATGCMRAVCLTGGNAPASALSAPQPPLLPVAGAVHTGCPFRECRGHRTPSSSSRSRNGSREPDRQAAEPTPDPPVRHPQPAKLGRELPGPEQPDLVLFADVHQPDQRGVRQVEPEQSATRAEHPPGRVRTGDVMCWSRRDRRRRERGSGLMAEG
jgi:hypothetical protein